MRIVKAEIRNIAQAVQSHQIKNGRLPGGLEPLVTPDENGVTFLADRTEIPVDPWGRPYAYRPDVNGGTFTIESKGRDGKPGGAGADADTEFRADASVRPRKSR